MGNNRNEYDLFMKDYYLKHAVCPKCGSQFCISTLVGYVLDMSNKEAYKDLNKCECSVCKDKHRQHDRISLEEFNKTK